MAQSSGFSWPPGRRRRSLFTVFPSRCVNSMELSRSFTPSCRRGGPKETNVFLQVTQSQKCPV